MNESSKLVCLSKSVCLLAAVLFLTGCTTPQIKSIRDEVTATPEAPISSYLVTISQNGFSPENISIFAGDTVTFQNTDTKTHEIASDPHPEHSLLPGLDSGLLYKGDNFEYTFQKSGQWGYHLEDNPSIKGNVIVE